MAIDLKLIKRKWKLTLVLWFALLIAVNAFNIIYFSQNPPTWDLARGDNNKARAEGNFSPGGNIVFSISPVESINGWHKSTILIKPLFSKSQEKRALHRIIRSLKGKFGEGSFGYDDIPSYKVKQKLMPIKLQIDFLLPDNDKIKGESVVFEMEREVSHPYQIGKNEYSVNTNMFRDQVRIQFHERSSAGYSQESTGIFISLFILFWFVGLIVIYKKIKKDPYT